MAGAARGGTPTRVGFAAMFLEGTLLEKLRKIEALHAGTTVDGEREAARRAAERIRARLAELRGREQDVVLVYSLPDPWKRQLFVALACKPPRTRVARARPVREDAGRGGVTKLLTRRTSRENG